MNQSSQISSISRIITGNYYFKPTVVGLVLLVEEKAIYSDNEESKYFRKANYEDIFILGLIKSINPKLE